MSEPEILLKKNVIGDDAISDADIAAVLREPVEKMQRNGFFTGRLLTRVKANNDFVLKLRPDFLLEKKIAEEWLERRLERERVLQVYHPERTWFGLDRGDQVQLGTIVPKLEPLHFEFSPNESTETGCPYSKALLLMLQAAEHGARLDEGLSNFGRSSSGKIFYLDDDLYEWTGLGVLVQTIENWMRVLGESGHERVAESLGHQLKEFWGQTQGALGTVEAMNQALSTISPLSEKQFLFRDALLKAAESQANRSKRIASAESLGSRFAVIADIHANLAALEAVTAEIDRLGIQQVLVLGDVIGYGPQPNECVAYVADRGWLTLMGNHDYAAVLGQVGSGFSKMARWALDWTLPRLNDASLRWLKSLPHRLEATDWLAVHGSPADAKSFYGYVYQLTASENVSYMKRNDWKMCLHGHTHIQGTWRAGPGHSTPVFVTSPNVQGWSNGISLICPGSVGQSRGGLAAACFAVCDTEKEEVEFKQVDYSVTTTTELMTEERFPEALKKRLMAGL
jgi:predicted phosphodiesterase